MNRLLAAAIAAVALCGAAAAQEPPPSPSADATPPTTVGSPRNAAEMLAGTLGSDIDTATFYELAAWCRSIGLAQSGSRRELQERLRRHYGLAAAPAPAAPGRTVTVRSTRTAEYFTIEQADETYLVLSGDVVVELRDPQKATTHTIRAGRLTFNQARRILSAGGGVQYTLAEGDRTETFEGRGLSLDLDTWEAEFIDGRSSKTLSRGGKDLTVTFEGSSITRLSGDQIVLEDGTFTSCDLADPHYAVRARKVWILAAGEWALRDAVLTVGRVPVLWMPFFFYPGDRLVFNPSFGYRQREGAFVQTTTYLIGRRKEEESLFSFLKLNEAQGSSYDVELRGLFLRKLPAKAPAETAEDSTLKLMVDGYSRLGAFVGLAGDFPPAVSFTGGIGFSRSIFEDSATGLYTPYYPYGTGTEAVWNESVLLGIPVPFRFGFEGDAKGSKSVWSGSLHFELFSDPSFTSDFYARKEGFQLTETLESLTGATAAATSNLTWEVTNRFDFSKLVPAPAIKTLSIPTLNGRFYWLSRDQEYLDNSPMEWDPGRTFYYPSSITAPSASLTISGELLRLGGAVKSAAAGKETGGTAPRTEPGKGFRGPFAPAEAASTAPAASPATGRLSLRRPAPRPDADIAAAPAGPSLAVTYQAAPRASLEHTFDAEEWDAPSDIDMGILYGTFETAGTGQVQVVGSLLGERLGLSLSLGIDSLWRLRFNPSSDLDGTPEWTTLLTSDAQQDRLDLTSSLGATLRPFDALSAFEGSTVSWKLGMRLVRLRWDGADALDPSFETRTLDLTADTVSEHRLKATVPFRARGTTGSLTLDAVLPPLAGALTASLDASAWILKGRVQLGGTQSGGILEDPTMSMRLSAEPGKGVSFSEEIQAGLESPQLSRSTSQFTAGGFTASFIAEQRKRVNILTGADLAGTDAFLPSTARLAYQGQTGPVWSWKDRVKIAAGLRTTWSMDVQRYTDNLFEFAPQLTLSVSEALDLTFSSLSVNTKTYRYIPGLAESLGEEWVNPVVDLAQSFNFFNPADRYASAFKIRSISLKAVHHLHDWDLTVEYSGSPELVTSPTKQYVWSPKFSILLQWLAVPELKAAASGDRDGVYLRQ